MKLVDGELTLRPLSEADWPTIALWNQDPDVLRFSEGDRIEFRPLEEVQSIYRGVSQHADIFVIEVDAEAVGDGWVQEMNLPRIIDRFPSSRCMRTVESADHGGEGYCSTCPLVDAGHRHRRLAAWLDEQEGGPDE